jgi:hypothetical protein
MAAGIVIGVVVAAVRYATGGREQASLATHLLYGLLAGVAAGAVTAELVHPGDLF